MSSEITNTQSLLLSLETSGDVCSAAVFRNGVFISEHIFRHSMHLSEHLIEHIDAVLKEAEVALSDVSQFAIGIGPGSFTGVRIGVMTIKMLAELSGNPLYAFDSLNLMAAEYNGVQNCLIVPMLPCRKDTVYCGAYRVNGVIPECVLQPEAVELPLFISQLIKFSGEQIIFCGPASLRYQSEILELMQAGQKFSFGDMLFPRASTAAKLALQQIKLGFSPADTLALVPLYISPPPITMPKKENSPPV